MRIFKSLVSTVSLVIALLALGGRADAEHGRSRKPAASPATIPATEPAKLPDHNRIVVAFEKVLGFAREMRFEVDNGRLVISRSGADYKIDFTSGARRQVMWYWASQKKFLLEIQSEGEAERYIPLSNKQAFIQMGQLERLVEEMAKARLRK